MNRMEEEGKESALYARLRFYPSTIFRHFALQFMVKKFLQKLGSTTKLITNIASVNGFCDFRCHLRGRSVLHHALLKSV